MINLNHDYYLALNVGTIIGGVVGALSVVTIITILLIIVIIMLDFTCTRKDIINKSPTMISYVLSA